MGRYVTLGQNASAREQTSFSAKSRDEQLIYMDFEVLLLNQSTTILVIWILKLSMKLNLNE